MRSKITMYFKVDAFWNMVGPKKLSNYSVTTSQDFRSKSIDI